MQQQAAQTRKMHKLQRKAQGSGDVKQRTTGG